ncbi:MAG: segregation/condensation protein A, partial [bacterium]|nr:segregation/condensation protein A [bacterium]
ISLAAVTEHFLQYLRAQTTLSPHELADWLAIAAKLLVIKSKALLPTLALPEEDELDATNLAWQIYQYKRFKEATKILREFEAKQAQSWGRHTSFVEKITFFPDTSVTASALLGAMKYLAKTLEEIVKIPKKILEEVITITQKIDHLQKLIREKMELKLRDLLGSAKSKTEIIVTFLALLEMVKQKILSVEQETIFSDIIIKKQGH